LREFTLPEEFDHTRKSHMDSIKAYVAKKYGEGWEINDINIHSRVVRVGQISAADVVSDTNADVKYVTLADGTKKSDGEAKAAHFEKSYPGYVMTDFRPLLRQAELTKMSPETQSARQAVSNVLRCKPWEVKIAPRSDGGYSLGLPETYVHSKNYDALCETVEDTIGEEGWYVTVNTKTRRAEVIPSDPPTFPGMIPFPMNQTKIEPTMKLEFAEKLPAPGQKRGEPLALDLSDAMVQIGGLAGAGKSVGINDIIASGLAAGFELAVIDIPDKAVDFEWCKDFVREGGWGCDSPFESVATLGNLYDEGKRRAALIKRHRVKKLSELPADVREDTKPILIVIDEVTGLFAKEVVPKSLPKDHPMRLEAEAKNVAVDMIVSYINKIAAEQRFVGMRIVLASQVASRDTGIDTKLRTNLHHKAQPLSSLVPVPASAKFPNGWATIGELEIGDQVIAPDGTLPPVSNLTPIRQGEVYRMTLDDGQTVDSDAGHQWLVSSHYSRSAQGAGRVAERGERPLCKVLTTEEIAQKVKLRAHTDKPINNYAIPLSAPVQFPEADLSLDPYVLGAWLGDGSTGGGEIAAGTSESCTDSNGVTDQDHMIAQLSEFDARPKPSASEKVITTRGLKVALREAGVLTEKHVPSTYLRASVEQRLALLQGLMDTDGWVSADRGFCAYVSTSKRLADGVVELVRSLGIKVSVAESGACYVSTDGNGEKSNTYTGSTAYRVQFRTALPVFRLPRKLDRLPDGDVPGSSLAHFITSVEKIGTDDVRCIEVDHPDHLYLTAGFVTTHNCLFGPNPTEANRKLIFPNADTVPLVPGNVATSPTASRGVGTASPQGDESCVFKSYYADTDDLYGYLERIGVDKHSNQEPTRAMIEEYMPIGLDEDDEAESTSVQKRKKMEAEARVDPETGERMSDFEYANLQRSRSVRKSEADAASGEGEV